MPVVDASFLYLLKYCTAHATGRSTSGCSRIWDNDTVGTKRPGWLATYRPTTRFAATSVAIANCHLPLDRHYLSPTWMEYTPQPAHLSRDPSHPLRSCTSYSFKLLISSLQLIFIPLTFPTNQSLQRQAAQNASLPNLQVRRHLAHISYKSLIPHACMHLYPSTYLPNFNPTSHRNNPSASFPWLNWAITYTHSNNHPAILKIIHIRKISIH